MKTTHLSIITGVGIVAVISFALIVVIIPSSLADQTGLTIGIEQNEVGVGEPLSFFVEISSPLQNNMYPTAVIVNVQNQTVWHDDDLPPNEYKGMTKVYYVQRDSENVPVINQTGKYTLIVTYGDKKASKDLTVTELIHENNMLHYYGAYTGIDEENTSVEIADQAYYLTTVHKSPSDLTAPNDTTIQFHGVAFTFPGCGQCLPMPTVSDHPYYVHVQFQDKTNETLEIRANQWSTMGPPMDFHEYFSNGTEIFPNGTRGTWVPRFHMDPIVTVFSNHEHPQAGITVTHDSVKFLVSVEDNLSQQSVSIGNTANSTASENQSLTQIHSTSLSPLKQFKSGITSNNVKCGQGLQLVIKAEDGSPACVKLDAAYMLIKRGWAASESTYPGGDTQFVLHTNSTIIPAHLPRSSGLRIPYYEPSRVINYSGFDGVYNETFLYRGAQKDYVLKPGSTGVITFKLEAVVSEQQGQSYPIPLPKSLNLTNYVIFYHEITSLEDLSKYPGVTIDDNGYGHFRACSTGPAGGGACIGGSFEGKNPIEAYVTDHQGVDVLFEPPAEVLPLGMNATSQVITMMMTVDSNAPRGTYLVELPSIGDSFLLTVGDRPYHE